jgi:Peptidase_C39 like family
MKNKCLTAGFAYAALVATVTTGVSLGHVLLLAPQPAQAQSSGSSVKTLQGCFLNSPFTAKIAFNPTNIRRAPSTTQAPVDKFTRVGQVVSFVGITTGQAISDAWTQKSDNMWYVLPNSRGYVASAVVSGYPRAATNCSTSTPATNSKLPTTTSQANAFFKMQFKDKTYNPTGPNSSSNCGPASLAMALAALGKEPLELTIQKSIDHASDLMERKKDASSSTWAELEKGVKRAGGTPENVKSWDALNQQLDKGNPVILNGYYQKSWRNLFPDRTGNGKVAHLNVLLGKTSDGKYIVADPMHTGGTVAMTKDNLSAFFKLKNQNGTPWGIAVTGL